MAPDQALFDKLQACVRAQAVRGMIDLDLEVTADGKVRLEARGASETATPTLSAFVASTQACLRSSLDASALESGRWGLKVHAPNLMGNPAPNMTTDLEPEPFPRLPGRGLPPIDKIPSNYVFDAGSFFALGRLGHDDNACWRELPVPAQADYEARYGFTGRSFYFEVRGADEALERCLTADRLKGLKAYGSVRHRSPKASAKGTTVFSVAPAWLELMNGAPLDEARVRAEVELLADEASRLCPGADPNDGVVLTVEGDPFGSSPHARLRILYAFAIPIRMSSYDETGRRPPASTRKALRCMTQQTKAQVRSIQNRLLESPVPAGGFRFEVPVDAQTVKQRRE